MPIDLHSRRSAGVSAGYVFYHDELSGEPPLQASLKLPHPWKTTVQTLLNGDSISLKQAKSPFMPGQSIAYRGS